MVKKRASARSGKAQRPADLMGIARRRRYRFLDGKLYKIIKVNKAAGLVWAYDFKKKERVILLYSDLLKRGQLAFKKWDVCDLLDINKNTLDAMSTTIENWPRSTPAGDKHGYQVRAFYSEDDVFEIRRLGSILPGPGRPPKNGTPRLRRKWLTEEELATKMEKRVGLYMKTEDGNFIPIWSAEI